MIGSDLYKRRLWLRWTVANALGELFGLGLTFVLIAFVFSRLEDESSITVILLLFFVAIASGAIEATIVGLAQWMAMRPWFPPITRLQWWRATLVGALVAYGLGYLPSTLMSLGEATTQEPVTEPPQLLILLFAAGLGAVAGAVLAFAQWLVLRRHVAQAGRWLPANMLAWLFGMPIIFAGIDVAFRQPSVLASMLWLAASLLLAGTVVGVIHGAFLASLVGPTQSPSVRPGV